MYRKIPKVTTQSLLSDLAAFSYRYFRVVKTCTVHGPFEVTKIATNVKTLSIGSVFLDVSICILRELVSYIVW